LLIEPEHESLSLSRPCQLIGLARASFYYQPQPESEEKLMLMRLLDEQYTQTPCYGIRRMTAWLRRQGCQVNHKRVAPLLRLMSLEAIYQKPRLSQPGAGHHIYPYLLRGLKIERINQVWSTDHVYPLTRRLCLPDRGD
jgi:putative transposase